MFGWIMRRRAEVQRHVDDCRLALMRVERTWLEVKADGNPEAMRRHQAALEVLHFRLARAADEAGVSVAPLTGGLPKPGEDPQ